MTLPNARTVIVDELIEGVPQFDCESKPHRDTHNELISHRLCGSADKGDGHGISGAGFLRNRLQEYGQVFVGSFGKNTHLAPPDFILDGNAILAESTQGFSGAECVRSKSRQAEAVQ